MVQVSLSTSTDYSGEQNALIEELGTFLTVNFELDEPAPSGGLKVFVDSDIEQIVNRLDLPGFAFNPTAENIDPASFGTSFDNSGFYLTIDEGATSASFTIDVFDNDEPDTTLPETFDSLVEANFSLVAPENVSEEDAADVGTLGDYTVSADAASTTVVFADEESQLTDTAETPENPETPSEPITPDPNSGSDALQVSLFTGPDYLIEDEGTVSAHAFNVTNGVIPEGGLVVSVDAPNLSEFDLDGISVEGGEIEAVRDGGFDLRMTQYTTLVNLPIADDGETEEGETATFSLAAGEGYEVVADYSGGNFNLVNTEADIPRGVITEPNNIIPLATDTEITPENPSFSGSDSIYFDIGDRQVNPDGTYSYIDYSEDVDVYEVELSEGDTIAVETFDVETNLNAFDDGLRLDTMIFDAEGNRLRDYSAARITAAPDKLFGGVTPFDENQTDGYEEFTALEDGTYYLAIGSGSGNVLTFPFQQEFATPLYDPFVFESGNGNRSAFGDYSINIDLLTPDNPRIEGTPTPPVSNPGVTNPPTLSLSANPATVDSEGNLTNAVVEHVEKGGLSSVTFTIEAEGEIPEEGIQFVLGSDANLFDYVSLQGQNSLPSTIGGQSLGAFYNEDGIPTGIRLRIEEPTMTVTYEASNPVDFYPDFLGNVLEQFEPLETDGAEDVNFFLQPGSGYEIASDAGETEITYYDSIEDVPASTGGSDIVPEVGVTISETELIETEGTETTLTFTLSEAPPPDGVTVYLDSEDNPVVGTVLSQFDVLNAEISGGNFPVSNGDSSGFFFNITEQTATITLSVFDELSVGLEVPPETLQEGILDLTFALQPQEGYTIDETKSEINLTIADNPDSQIQVGLTGSVQTDEEEADEESTTLIESEGTVSIQTFRLSAPPPEEGLTVSVSTDSLDDFDLDTIKVTGGTIDNLRSDGFDLTITEREATISLPVVDDGTDEGNETATFTLEPSDTYELNPAATEATFSLAETLDQVAIAEESESNSTLSEANAIGLSDDRPSVSLSGLIGESFVDLPEDVDFYSFNLEVGQTVNLDIDTEEILPETINARPVVYPALADTLQKPDTELRLFDAEGNELAANNDGAADDEEFSRDPYLDYTAELAGTYYVGVSQLGNDNYDPNVARSGSGWTFPEVGVFNGFYDLTATLEDSTTEPANPTNPEQPTDSAEPTDPEAFTTEPLFGFLEADTLKVEGSDQSIFAGDSDDLIDASTGDGDNRIYGGEGDDILISGSNNRIFGEEGSDRFLNGANAPASRRDFALRRSAVSLMGETPKTALHRFFFTAGGDNTVTDGEDADQFWIANAEIPEATNIITDFTSGEDIIGIAGLGIGFEDVTITDTDAGVLVSTDSADLALFTNSSFDAIASEDNFTFA